MILYDTVLSPKQVRGPRASGDDPSLPLIGSSRADVDPARAGMILLSDRTRLTRSGGPRASGDDPALRCLLCKVCQWTPRERG